MPIYQRTTPVHAVQFFEEDFHENKMKFPNVFDRAMFSATWFGKTAKDGRYYISNQPNSYGTADYINLNEGDYIIREEIGMIYVLPKEVFEQNFVQVEEKSNK